MGDLDPRLNAFRDDLADANLMNLVKAEKYTFGKEARIKVGRAPVFGKPALGEVQTFFHYGENITIFDDDGKFSWCKSERDGYVGYIELNNIGDIVTSDDVRYVINMGTYLYQVPDLRERPVDFFPRNSKVYVSTDNILTRDTFYIQTIDGMYIPRNCLSSNKSKHDDVVENASLYMGCPYLWGGRSALGVDCSGLVQEAFEEAGISILRDSYMQKKSLGKIIDYTGFENLHRGDVVFAGRHVALYDGKNYLVHADGISMCVIVQPVDNFMRDRNLSPDDIIVRRYKS